MGEIIFLFCRVYLVVDYREPRREILFFTGDGVSYRFSGQAVNPARLVFFGGGENWVGVGP